MLPSSEDRSMSDVQDAAFLISPVLIRKPTIYMYCSNIFIITPVTVIFHIFTLHISSFLLLEYVCLCCRSCVGGGPRSQTLITKHTAWSTSTTLQCVISPPATFLLNVFFTMSLSCETESLHFVSLFSDTYFNYYNKYMLYILLLEIIKTIDWLSFYSLRETNTQLCWTLNESIVAYSKQRCCSKLH